MTIQGPNYFLMFEMGVIWLIVLGILTALKLALGLPVHWILLPIISWVIMAVLIGILAWWEGRQYPDPN